MVGLQQPGRHPPAAEHLLGMRPGPGEVVDGQPDLELRFAVRLAGLLVDHVGQLPHPPGEHATPLREHILAAVEAEAGPPGDGLAGPGDRGLDRGGVVDGVYGRPRHR